MGDVIPRRVRKDFTDLCSAQGLGCAVEADSMDWRKQFVSSALSDNLRALFERTHHQHLKLHRPTRFTFIPVDKESSTSGVVRLARTRLESPSIATRCIVLGLANDGDRKRHTGATVRDEQARDLLQFTRETLFQLGLTDLLAVADEVLLEPRALGEEALQLDREGVWRIEQLPPETTHDVVRRYVDALRTHVVLELNGPKIVAASLDGINGVLSDESERLADFLVELPETLSATTSEVSLSEEAAERSRDSQNAAIALRLVDDVLRAIDEDEER